MVKAPALIQAETKLGKLKEQVKVQQERIRALKEKQKNKPKSKKSVKTAPVKTAKKTKKAAKKASKKTVKAN